MSLTEYEDFVYGATYCDQDDPITEWQRIYNEQQRVVDWLKGKKQVTSRAPMPISPFRLKAEPSSTLMEPIICPAERSLPDQWKILPTDG